MQRAREMSGRQPASLSHDVAIEGVEDALVGELERVIEHNHVLQEGSEAWMDGWVDGWMDNQ